MRNAQLSTLVQNFKTHESPIHHDNVVVIGDFNITPWSPYYDILTQAFSGKLINITQRIPLLFTRKLKGLSLIFAHIDHVWASS